MTHEEFKALDEFDKFDVLEEMEVYVGLHRSPSGSGTVTYKDQVTECHNRESLIAQCELMFLLRQNTNQRE